MQLLSSNLLDRLPGMAYRCRNDGTRTMEFVSRGCFALTGYPPEAFIGNHEIAYTELIHPDDREPLRQEVRKALDEKRAFHLTYRIRTVREMEKWVWERGNGIYTPEGEVEALEGFATDITQLMSVQETLRESVELHRQLIARLPDMVCITDTEGLILFMNEVGLQFSGFSNAEDLRGRTIFSFIAPEDVERAVENYSAMFETSLGPKEYRMRNRQGVAMDFEVNGEVLRQPGEAPFGLIFVCRDITERKRMEERLSNEKVKFQALADNAPFGMMMITQDGILEYLNPKFTELFGYDLSDIRTGPEWFSRAYPDEAYRMEVLVSWKKDCEHLYRGETARSIFSVVCKDGRRKIVSITCIQLDKGEYMVAFEDVTERQEHEQGLAYLATHDTLTRLPNRRSLEDALARATAVARRGRTSILLFMDLDNFKVINDTLGHAAGDKVLVRVSELLKQTLRVEDVLFRWGGDEFALLLDGIGAGAGLHAAERLMMTVEEEEILLSGQRFVVTLSVGVIEIDGTMDPGELLSRADMAMYKAKELGRNRVVVYGPTL